MIKLVILVALALVAWKLATGRWPWQPKAVSGPSVQDRAGRQRASTLLGVAPGAGRQDIIEAHRRLLAQVHPDRGGSNELVHEANAARDTLLAALPPHATD
ncbi:hypothetical protein HNO88_001127 [Novosphingobium chloroacetimidivorans]|uniref:J domain-containing protein n=1 Tax=Novosphingobium chloroacetimidivorans TaxID=1428314 RepID=A0A7W7K7W3_9SPHN|nr:J domain-containing protein [Novosphingobium chloroacetimidivorans]MBB4857816.1 hypothetical protein [Novosphingobium chloroacetimidivorans]